MHDLRKSSTRVPRDPVLSVPPGKDVDILYVYRGDTLYSGRVSNSILLNSRGGGHPKSVPDMYVPADLYRIYVGHPITMPDYVPVDLHIRINVRLFVARASHSRTFDLYSFHHNASKCSR